jgi:hypothetical protein
MVSPSFVQAESIITAARTMLPFITSMAATADSSSMWRLIASATSRSDSSSLRFCLRHWAKRFQAMALSSNATASIANVITSVVIFHCFIGYLFTLPEQCLSLAILALNDFTPPFLQLVAPLNLPHQYGNDNSQHKDDYSENHQNVIMDMH